MPDGFIPPSDRPKCGVAFEPGGHFTVFCKRLPHETGAHSILPEGWLREQYPEVQEFVLSMYYELWVNSGKGDQVGWRTMSLRQAWGEIAWHHAKLAVAVKEDDESLMRELAADVANMSMMLVDILDQRKLAAK